MIAGATLPSAGLAARPSSPATRPPDGRFAGAIREAAAGPEEAMAAVATPQPPTAGQPIDATRADAPVAGDAALAAAQALLAGIGGAPADPAPAAAGGAAGPAPAAGEAGGGVDTAKVGKPVDAGDRGAPPPGKTAAEPAALSTVVAPLLAAGRPTPSEEGDRSGPADTRSDEADQPGDTPSQAGPVPAPILLLPGQAGPASTSAILPRPSGAPAAPSAPHGASGPFAPKAEGVAIARAERGHAPAAAGPGTAAPPAPPGAASHTAAPARATAPDGGLAEGRLPDAPAASDGMQGVAVRVAAPTIPDNPAPPLAASRGAAQPPRPLKDAQPDTRIDLNAVAPASANGPAAPEAQRGLAAPALPGQPAPAPMPGPAAPAAPAEAVVAHHLDLAKDGAWLDRLAQDIARSADPNGSLRFTLAPERLGRLDVQLSAAADGTAIRLTTETREAHRIVADAQPRLVAEARAQGLRVSDTQVDLDRRGGGQGGNAAQSQAFGNQNSGGGGQPQRHAAWPGPSAVAPAARTAAADAGNDDLYA